MTKYRFFALIVTAVTALSGAAAAEDWKPKALSDGQPDVRGFYRPQISGTLSLVRPRRGIGVEGVGEYEKSKEASDLSKSRVVDPADRQVPYQPWARAKQKALEAWLLEWRNTA